MEEGHQPEGFEQPEEGFDGMDEEEGFQGDPAQYGEEGMDDEEDDEEMQQQILMQQQLQYQRQQEEAYHMHQQQQQLHHQQHYEQYQGEDGQSPGGEEEGYAQSEMSMRDQIEEDPIQDKIAKIIQICKENDALFGDSEFPTNEQSLYKDLASPPDYAADTPEVEWKRPHEIAPDDAVLIKDGTAPGDVKQGLLGDCWLLSSFLTLSTNPQLLKNLIVYDGLEYGFAVF